MAKDSLECDCPCHNNSNLKHCDQLSCIPCCTICEECGKNIKLGKLREHHLLNHGIDTPPATLEMIDRLIQELKKDL